MKTEVALPEPLEQEVQQLLKRGEHAAAAAALWAAGHPRRAGAIYEQIFEHKKALNAYEAGGDLVGAVRAALEVGDLASLDRLVTLAIASGQGDALLASLQRAGRAAEEARVHLARGEMRLAAEAFERAGQLDRAAKALEEIGDARGAGVLLERHLETHADDTDGYISLGRILARFGRHEDAIMLFQRAIRSAEKVKQMDAVTIRVAPTMTLSFLSLGYEHAAHATLKRWQQAYRRLLSTNELPEGVEEPPTTFEELLHSERAAALAAIQSNTAEAEPSHVLNDLLGAEARSPRGGGQAPALLLGGRYLLGEPLGGGGVGQVFRAFDAFSDRPVAVKIFGAQVLSSEAVQSFAREARAFAGLQHPAVATLVELNMEHGFVVTEFVSAPTFEEKITVGGESGWLIPAVRALLDLLSTVHRTGLVHGSLKPTNVFVLPAGVRVVDVGAHRLLALRSTETGGLASVWPYLSPEQLFGAPATVSGDLYAVGAMLYRALTGSTPFLRAEDDRRDPPPPASTRNPLLPPAWDAFLARCLHPGASERFADAAEMNAAIPQLPSEFLLPAAAAIGGVRAQYVLTAASRYAKAGLVFREHGGAIRTYEGTDLLLERDVWLVEADDFDRLQPLVVCARLWRGVQPVYDVIPDAKRVVVARDKKGDLTDFAPLRAVPQGLMRDLAAVARAIEWLHEQGLAFGGFPVERALGPIGPRLKIAPAPIPVAATDSGKAADWDSFEKLVDTALDLAFDPSLDGRGRVLAMLHDRRLLDRADLEAVGAEAQKLVRWPAFLDTVSSRLVQGAGARIVARIVAGVVRG